jgi:hypothetical protein
MTDRFIPLAPRIGAKALTRREVASPYFRSRRLHGVEAIV